MVGKGLKNKHILLSTHNPSSRFHLHSENLLKANNHGYSLHDHLEHLQSGGESYKKLLAVTSPNLSYTVSLLMPPMANLFH